MKSKPKDKKERLDWSSDAREACAGLKLEGLSTGTSSLTMAGVDMTKDSTVSTRPWDT